MRPASLPSHLHRDRVAPGWWACGLLLSLVVVSAAAADTPSAYADFDAVLPLMAPASRDQLRQRAATWSQWTVPQQASHARRAADWAQLPASERATQRERYFAWQSLPASEQARVRAIATHWASATPAQRQALRAQFDALDGSTRRGWLLGPSLGADYAALQPLLAQVPEAEHAPLLRALRAMTALQRARLAVLVQRTAPQDRAGLRRDLLATSATNRDGWLQLRLDR